MWYSLHLIRFRPNLWRIAWQPLEKINDLNSGLNFSKHLERMANFLSKNDQAKISLNLECVTMVFWLRGFKTFHSSGYLTMMLCLSVRQTEEVCCSEPNNGGMGFDLWPFTVVDCHAMNLPVNDPILVQEHEGWGHLSSIEPGTSFIEFAWTLDLEHQVSAIHIFHDKEQTVLKITNRRNRFIIQ